MKMGNHTRAFASGDRPQGGEGGGLTAFLSRLDAYCRRVARWMIIASGWGTLGLAVMVTVDVLMRRILGTNLGGTEEIAGYIFAISISWSLAAAFYARAHIRIDVLYHYFPASLRTLLDLLSVLALLSVALFLIYSSWLVLTASYARNSLSASALQIPLVIPQAIWLFGSVWFALSLTVSLLWALLMSVQGHALSVRRAFGVVTAEEEAREAIQQSLGKD